MRRRFLSSSNSNYFFIVYTTSDENVINLEMSNIISNSYDDGVGYIQFSSVPISLPARVFSDCSNLTSVILVNGILSIGDYAFFNCSSLTSVTIPDGVTSIGKYVFSGCTSLTSIIIPDSVTEIGGWAFGHCTSLKEVYCKPTTPPAGGAYMFSYNSSFYKPIGCTIYVPTSSVDAYKSAEYWSDYADYIVGYDF